MNMMEEIWSGLDHGAFFAALLIVITMSIGNANWLAPWKNSPWP
jgi:hypothetical protein